MLGFLDTNQGVSVENVNLQSLLVLFNWHAEMIFPAIQVGGFTGCFTFFITVFINLNSARIDLRGVQVKHKQVLSLAADQLTDDLVAMLGIPAHQRHDLSEEQRAYHFLRFAPCSTPCKGVFDILAAGTYSQLFLFLVHQHLNKLGVRRFLQASSIY